MRDRVDEIRARGAELVVIGNGAAHFAAAFREDQGLDGPLLIDPDLVAYHARAAGMISKVLYHGADQDLGKL